jgi:long-subunit fatty acid transport protein
MRSIPLLLACLLAATGAAAQTDAEALRYSSTQFTGTSRTAAMGGAMTGLGGDISAVNINPAGLGQMGISEFTFTGGLSFTGSNTEFLGQRRSDDKASFQINQVGAVWVPKKNFNGIKSLSVAFNFNRQANYNERFVGRGINTKSSFSDSYADILNFDDANLTQAANDYPFGASLAYLSGIVDFFEFPEAPESNGFYSIIDLPIEQVMQVSRTGSMNDISIGTGIALNDFFMIGASLGIPSLTFEEDFFWRENDVNNTTPEFNSWEKRDLLRVRGTGINAKLGFLATPNKNFRIGASFTTPTRFSISDRFTTFFRADYRTETIENFNTPSEGIFDYRMVTPWRLNVGASALSGKYGLISIDYELSNPGTFRFDFTNQNPNLRDFEQGLNDAVSSKYVATHTIRAGLEAKIKERYRVRGGAQYRTSPFANQESQREFAKNNLMTFSGGVGYRGSNFFVDAVYFHTLRDELLVPYTVSFTPDAPIAQSKYIRGTLLLTVGVKF